MTRVNAAWLRKIEAERVAQITPEQKAEQDTAALKHAANVAQGILCSSCSVATCGCCGKSIPACGDAYQSSRPAKAVCPTHGERPVIETGDGPAGPWVMLDCGYGGPA